MKENLIQPKSYEFAKKIVFLYQELKRKKEFELGSQLLRSYWLRLLRDTQILDSATSQRYISECEEILRILGSIRKTVGINS